MPVQIIAPVDNLVGIQLAYDNQDYFNYARLVNDAFLFLSNQQLCKPTKAFETHLEAFLDTVLTTFVGPKFCLKPQDCGRFMRFNSLIANLLAASSYETADCWLDQLLDNGGAIKAPVSQNLPKVLMLLSPRIQRDFDFKLLEFYDQELVALWWLAYSCSAGSTIDVGVEKNLLNHLARPLPEAYPQTHNVCDTVFLGPYKGSHERPHLARDLKEQVNVAVQKQWPQLCVTNNPDKKKIAVISGHWRSSHVVYRCTAPLIKALQAKYDVDLFHLQEDPGVLWPLLDGFKHIYTLSMDGMRLKGLPPLLKNNYGAVLYPDVGMDSMSVILSNQRFAPVQIATLGHPISTFGSKVDYFISGALAEPEYPARNYSEKLILIPGIGSQSIKPAYKPLFPARGNGPVSIAAAWSPYKFNRKMLEVLRGALDNAECEAKIHFFTGGGITKYSGFRPFKADVEAILGDRAILRSDRGGYDGYMGKLEYMDFGIDSYPWGGYNTIIDMLHVHKPVITLQGDQWYNRAASATNKLVGLGDLVATNYTEYRDLITRMIDDPTFQAAMTSRIDDSVMDERIYNNQEDPRCFVAAVSELLGDLA